MIDLAQDSKKMTPKRRRRGGMTRTRRGFKKLEGDDKEQSIAGRLALLSSAMEQTDEKTNDYDEEVNGKS